MGSWHFLPLCIVFGTPCKSACSRTFLAVPVMLPLTFFWMDSAFFVLLWWTLLFQKWTPTWFRLGKQKICLQIEQHFEIQHLLSFAGNIRKWFEDDGTGVACVRGAFHRWIQAEVARRTRGYHICWSEWFLVLEVLKTNRNFFTFLPSVKLER